jgi:hypothetical protein
MNRWMKEPLLRSAVVTTTFFALLWVGGAPARVSVLSGTLDGGRVELFFGLLYALSWFSVVVLVPVLTLAGVASVLLGQARRGGARSATSK